ncbi:MAG: hypothetical protein NDI69_11810 [Bacteriovoracaceae bacterium]|nr:hypothetical protein [Bacteriovoracaceae bacterium]
MKTLFLLLPILMACSSERSFVRSEYQVFHVDEFLISNAYVHPTELQAKQQVLRFNYPLIMKNLMNFERQIDLTESFIMIGLRKIPIFCQTLQKKETEFTIGSEETLAINCLVQVNKAEGIFQVSDYKAMIEIPLEKRPVQFLYLLRAEDFQ